MKRALLLSLLITLSLGTVTYAGIQNPSLVKDIIIKIDTLGITSIGEKEQKRINQIRSLPIPYEKRKVLIERTIFMGADVQMVYLALGNPRSASTITKASDGGGKVKVEQWYYHFTKDKRPTILEFENGILTAARKTSVLDIGTNN